jgi:membrane-associated phospholipid phosphatase
MAIASVSCEGWAIALIALAFVLSRERSGRRTIAEVLPLFAGLLLAGLAVQVLKRIVDVPRPLTVYGTAVHVLLHPLRQHAFPSGHSASIAALAAFAVRRYGRVAWPLVLLAILGGISRVYVGAHWTLDVAAGWAVGIAAAPVAAWAWERGRTHLARPAALPTPEPE